jgi:hypothetical protein
MGVEPLNKLQLVTMAANMNADTVREQQKAIRKLEAENASLRRLIKPLLKFRKGKKR